MHNPRIKRPLAPCARVYYAPSPECTRYRQAANHTHVGSALQASGSSPEDASTSSQPWICVIFFNPMGRLDPRLKAGEWTWDVTKLQNKSFFVCLNLQDVGGPPFCQALKDHLHLIRKLCIHGRDLSRKHPVIEMLIRNNAPQMEMLALHCSRNSGRTMSDLEPRELFRDDAPRLWWMTVMPGMEVLPSTLSRLTQYTVLYRADELVNGFDLHAQLSLMTSLEVLEIESDTRGRLNWEGRPEIRLQRLSRLTVKDDTDNCEQLLAKIIVPAPCIVEVAFLDANAQDVCSLVRRWITAGRDGMTQDRRTVQRIPDASEDGVDVMMYIRKTGSMEGRWNATWTFGGRLASLVCAGVASGWVPQREQD